MRLTDKACIHQSMLAEAIGAEVTTSLPKDEVEIEVIVGKLLGNTPQTKWRVPRYRVGLNRGPRQAG
jgi:hypothetical protein